MRVTIFDYGAGNLHSLTKAIAAGDTQVIIETDPARAGDTDALVLPGVGAFGLAADRLAPGLKEMRNAIAGGLPTLGICLGMQLLFDGSEEGGGTGLGVIPGRVTRLMSKRSPQIGWNSVDDGTDRLLSRAPLASVYYANGFVCRPDDVSTVVAWSTHETDRFPAMVRAGMTIGVQFHPEKSSRAGVRFIRAFLDEARP
jgi:glutamine amidotransferase